jgi:hypothetical protein
LKDVRTSWKETLVATLTLSIDLPPVGELETSGDGTSPTDAQMEEETQARQDFLDLVSPYFDSLPNRPLRRTGNVSRVKLLGAGVWSQLNHYLLLITSDGGGGAGIREELLAVLPEGSRVSDVGSFGPVGEWPEPAPA